MLKKFLVLMAMLYAAACFAAVDVNKATAAELDSIKGIGPGISTKILDERKKGSFKDWTDFVDRVKGVGEGNAAKFSAEGMTVNGDSFKGVAPAAKKVEAKKADAKAAAPAAGTASAAAPATVDAKAQAAADKEAAKKAKADEKAAKAEEAKKAKEAKAAAKAEAAKPAASAAKK